MARSVPSLNRQWHLAHRMPARATFEQRVKWHLAHAKHCACRPIPAKLLEQMRERGIHPEGAVDA